MAKRRNPIAAPDFDVHGFERWRESLLTRTVAVDHGFGPRFADLPPEELEARIDAALRARARWAKGDDFSRALVDPAVPVHRPEVER